jgi:predicted glycoside hydrolase/deacetylase ChbG (UPF0249 family)
MTAIPASDYRRLLIVNADDYGLTAGVSRAILDAHRHGIVTSTSVIALGPAFAETVGWLLDAPGLGVGGHLALVGEDPPLLSAAEIPTLVDERGKLALSWRQFLPRAAAGRIDPQDIHRELGAQLQRLVDAGLTLDHLDTHQNLHLWPLVGRVVMELGELYGVRALRVTRSSARSPVGVTVRRLAARLERDCRHAGWAFPGASTGLDEAGHLDAGAMIQSLFRLAATGAPTAELATHPGAAEDPFRMRYLWGYLWEDEYAALRTPAVRAAIDELGYRLGTFADLTAVVAAP